MSGDGMKIGNKPEVDSAQRIANEMTAPETERTCPPNHVARTLTTRDRNYIYAAAMAYIQKNRGPKDQRRYNLLSTLLRFEESRQYFSVAKDDLDDLVDEWNGKRTFYRLWKQVHSGTLTLEDAKKSYPSFAYDPENPPERPPSMAPDYTEEERVGPSETIFIPKKLDDWTKIVLLKMEWDTVPSITPTLNEGIVAIMEKYGLVTDDEL